MATLYGGISQDNTTLYLAGTSTINASNSFVDTNITSSSLRPGHNYRTNITTIQIENTLQPDSITRGFYECQNLQNYINGDYLNTSKVTNMCYMFAYCSGDNFTAPDVSNWDTSKVTDMSYMFNSCFGDNFTAPDVSKGDTSNVTSMNGMFGNCNGTSFTAPDVSKWDTSNVTSMSYMFFNCSDDNFTAPNVSRGNTASVIYMRWMFNNCSGANFTSINLRKGQINNCDCTEMFKGCTNLKAIYCDNTGATSVSTNMFTDCTSIIGGNSTRYDANYTDGTYARPDGANPGYFRAGKPIIKYRTDKDSNEGKNFIDLCYPVGSMVQFSDDRSPNVTFGVGTGLKIDKPLQFNTTSTSQNNTIRTSTPNITFANTTLSAEQSPRCAYTPNYAYLSDGKTAYNTFHGSSSTTVQGKHSHLLRADNQTFTSSNGNTYNFYDWSLDHKNGSAVTRGTVAKAGGSAICSNKSSPTGYAFTTNYTNVDSHAHTHTLTITSASASAAHSAGISNLSLTVDVNRYPRTNIATGFRLS